MYMDTLNHQGCPTFYSKRNHKTPNFGTANFVMLIPQEKEPRMNHLNDNIDRSADFANFDMPTPKN